MGETRTQTLVLHDSRGSDRLLRVSWHPESWTIVFSHWAGAVCTASTPVKLPEASKVIEFLVGAFRDVAESATATKAAPETVPGLVDRLTKRFRPQLASVRRLRERVVFARSTNHSGRL